jgi:hypothetical protein
MSLPNLHLLSLNTIDNCFGGARGGGGSGSGGGKAKVRKNRPVVKRKRLAQPFITEAKRRELEEVRENLKRKREEFRENARTAAEAARQRARPQDPGAVPPSTAGTREQYQYYCQLVLFLEDQEQSGQIDNALLVARIMEAEFAEDLEALLEEEETIRLALEDAERALRGEFS